jgi:ankyrin repeat protein
LFHKFGETALMHAVDNGDERMVSCLLEAGVDLDVTDVVSHLHSCMPDACMTIISSSSMDHLLYLKPSTITM